MSVYTKLFHSIVTSTIWSEDDQTRIIWITMLAMANQHGELEASVPGLAKLATVPIEATEAAIQKLLSPDPYSRTKDFDGRRIEIIDGGWRILNYEKYRERGSIEDKREQDRIRQQRHRASRSVTDGHARSRKIAYTDTDTDIKKRESGAAAPSPSSLPPEVEQWNSCVGLRHVRSVSDERLNKLRTRRKDPFFTEHWRAAIDRICQSDFCKGRNDKSWLATFDWFIRPDTVARVMEGEFDKGTQGLENCI